MEAFPRLPSRSRLTARRPDGPGPGPGPCPEPVGMSVIDHLGALRRALIVSVLAWAACSVGAFFFWGRAVEFLMARGGVATSYYHTPTGAFALALKVALYMGFAAALPVIVHQAWWFVSPGLHTHERRLVLPLIVATLVFFAIGVGFAIFALPLFMRVLGGFAPHGLHYLPFLEDYVNFALILVMAFGLVFEIPVVVYSLGLVGILRSAKLRSNRLYWAVGLAVIANLATPGVDPLTPMLMFVPLYLLWEGAVLVLRLQGR